MNEEQVIRKFMETHHGVKFIDTDNPLQVQAEQGQLLLSLKESLGDSASWSWRGSLTAALFATTTESDDQGPGQGLENVLNDDGQRFWSSDGSETKERTETLIFKLRPGPVEVRAIRITAFRAAQFQPGAPLYSPEAVSISFAQGSDPETPAFWTSEKYDYRSVDLPQVFPIPPIQTMGTNLRIHLHGAPQQQATDHKFYLAIARIEALTRPLTGSEVAGSLHQVRSGHTHPLLSLPLE